MDTARIRRRRSRLFVLQGGRCFWCQCTVVELPPVPRRKHPPQNMATLDHLDSRLSPHRGQWRPGVERTVLACLGCNLRRGAAEESALRAG